MADLDGVKELFLKTTEPSAGINPDSGYIYKWIEKIDGNHIYRGKDSLGNVFNIGTAGIDGVDGTNGINGTDGVDGVDGTNGVDGIDGVDGAVGADGAMTVEYIVNHLTDVTLPNSTSMQSIYSDDFNVSATGDCYLDVSLGLKAHSASNDLEFELYIDGQFIEIPYVEEHKDTSTRQENWRAFTGIILGELSVGSHNIELFFSKESTGGTAIIKSYSLKVVRY